MYGRQNDEGCKFSDQFFDEILIQYRVDVRKNSKLAYKENREKIGL